MNADKRKMLHYFLQLTHYNILLSPLPYALDNFVGVKFCTHAKKGKYIYFMFPVFWEKFCHIWTQILVW